MNRALPNADIRSSDLAIAMVLTAALFGGSVLALLHARLDHNADFPVIDPGVAIPIAVRPVADVPAGEAKSGSRKAKRKTKRASTVPLAWRRKVPSSSAPTKPPEPELEPIDPQTIMPPSLDELEPNPEVPPDDPAEPEPPIEEAGEPPPEDSSAEVETPEDPPIEEELPDIDEGQQDAGSEEQPEAGGEGQPDAEGEPGSEGTDPLLERAIAFYRARLVAWFSARFRVTGSGLSPAQLAKYRVRVHIDLGEDLRIVDYQILSSDHPDFEAAARSMLEKMRGMKLPPPPENYPSAVQQQLTVTFTCAEDTCD
jgi:hypothetical protein